MIMVVLNHSIDKSPTQELTAAFIELKYGMFEDYYFDYGHPHFECDTLYIKSKGMCEDPAVRFLLLEYLI